MTNQERDIFKFYIIGAVVTSIILFCSICFASPPPATVNLSKAVIHHTASPDWSVERIRKIHVEERGWDDVGYHFIIRENGDIEKGRSLYKQGAHARGRNNRVGIALTGYDDFTDKQIASLKKLIKKLGVKDIERHHEKCPGHGLNIKEL